MPAQRSNKPWKPDWPDRLRPRPDQPLGEDEFLERMMLAFQMGGEQGVKQDYMLYLTELRGDESSQRQTPPASAPVAPRFDITELEPDPAKRARLRERLNAIPGLRGFRAMLERMAKERG